MSDKMKWAIGLALVIALGAFGIYGDGVLGASSAQAQAKLQERASQRLLGVGALWARVTVDGQTAILAGIAPSEEELAIVRGAVRSSVWDGGWFLGGITAVRSDDVRIWSPRIGAYAWRAEIDTARVRLSGSAPDRATSNELGILAGALFPNHDVINDVITDPMLPGEGWAAAAHGALAMLSHLRVGQVDLTDFELLVAGVPKDDDSAAAAQRALERLGRTVSATSRVELATVEPGADHVGDLGVSIDPVGVPPRRPEPEPRANAELTAAPAERPVSGPALDCQTRFDAELSGKTITFDLNSAELSVESLPLLEALAVIAVECDPFTLRVEGHTDDTGVSELNQLLSEQRAAAVVERFAVLGVPRDRLSATGFGALRPLADNASLDGRRANRRIEIIVSP